MKYDFDLELVNNNSLLLMLQKIKKQSVILEFGPANGRLTKYLKQQLDCEVYLAEIDEEAGKEALQYGKELVVGDVENFEWFEKFHDIRFDYILFADVLEHLRAPKEVLAKSKLLLKDAGSIILSVPNMSHNSVLIELMNNRLNYTNVGLLDNTHIHFFTKNSLEQMIKDCDLYPCKRLGTYCEVGKNEIPNGIGDVKGISKEFWNSRPYGEVYQFVYELKKGKEYIEEELNLLKPYYNHYYAQLYTDDGTGMNEELSSKFYYDVNVKNHRIEANIENDCKTVRFDVINTSGMIKVNCISVRSDDSEEVIPIASHNAGYVYDDIYMFDTEDPMFLFDTGAFKNLSQPKMIFDFDILSADSLVNHQMSEIIQNLEQKYEEHKHQTEELLKENDKLKEKIEKMNQRLSEMEREALDSNSKIFRSKRSK